MSMPRRSGAGSAGQRKIAQADARAAGFIGDTDTCDIAYDLENLTVAD